MEYVLIYVGTDSYRERRTERLTLVKTEITFIQTDGRTNTDRRTDIQTNGQTDKLRERQTDRQTAKEIQYRLQTFR